MKPIERIIDLGSLFYHIDKPVLKGPSRRDPLVRVRFSIMGACREEGHTLESIGAAFNRDHGTVCYAVKRLNPDSMAELWGNHMNFLETVKARTDLDDKPVLDVVSATKIALADIDQKIAKLTELRKTMIDSLAQYQKNMEVIQTL